MSLCNREASVVRPSVCLSVCPSVCPSVYKLLHASRYFYHKHDSIATKLAHDGHHMVLHPGCAQGQGQRSRDTDTFLPTWKYYKHDWIATKLAHDGPHMDLHPGYAQGQGQGQRSRDTDTFVISSCRQIAGSRPNLHTMVRRRARIYDVLKVKVKVKGHVIRALLWCHEMFSIQYGLTFCLYMRSLYETPLYSPSSITIRQLDV